MNFKLREPLLLTAFTLACATVAAMEEPAQLKAASSGLRFTSEPSESEIFKARVFDEPLLPFGGKPAAAENKALADALVSYVSRTNLDDFSSLNDFLARNPDSKWRDSLLLHLGVEYYNLGYFSRALDAWRRGWDGCGALDEASSKTQRDRLLGELARMYSKLGRRNELRDLLASVKDRGLDGPATQLIAASRNALSLMDTQPGFCFRCGPLALDRIISLHDPSKAASPLIFNSRSTTNGFSLSSVAALSRQLGLNYQMAFRNPDAPFLIPAVIHWKVGHYAALVKRDGQRFLIQDHTFQDSAWVSEAALKEESSGYFLVPPGPLPAGWRSVSETDGDKVWGKGVVGGPDPNGPSPADPKPRPPGPPPCHGMPVYSMSLLYASLNLQDTPLGYKPPVGPAISFTATYNQKESHQPATFYYSNLGQKWTCNWIAYINDNPTSPNADVSFYVDGGGTYPFTGFNPSNQTYLVETMTQTLLLKTSSASYEMQFPDGSKKEFKLSDGSTGTSRRIFLTQIIDPYGNTVTLNYDTELRITNITDAIGQPTTLSYSNTTYPFAITSVTDPFRRTASFEYTASGLLSKVTDVIGLSSTVYYDTNEFITSLATPYGTSTFSNGQAGTTVWLQCTDPLGQSEYLEFNQGLPVPDSDPPAQLPHGVKFWNEFLSARNSFYWDKTAFAQGQGDWTKATIYHWCHTADLTSASRVPESVKKALESRIWYNYPNQQLSYAAAPGMINKPNVTARVLDDGTTQLYYKQYNALGNMTTAIDPVGRQFTYTYSSNNVDLLQVAMTGNGQNQVLKSLTYNSQHLPFTITDASGQVCTYTYNARGQPLSRLDPLGGLSTFSYDTNGYLMSASSPPQSSNSVANFTYDSFGRVRTISNTEGYTLTHSYDALDRLTQVTHPDGTYEQYVYNLLDLQAHRDRLGRWSTNMYNADRQLAERIDPLGRVTQFQWCRCGALTSLIDPMGRATSWRYDVQSRLVTKQFADGSTIGCTYENSTSRVKTRYDEKGNQTVYEYNADDTTKSRSYPNTAVPTPPIAYFYDPNYRRLQMVQDGVGTTSYTYYPIGSSPALGAGRLASISGPLPNSTVTYQYDAIGRVVNRSINGVAEATTFDSLGRRTVVTNALGTFRYTYVNATQHVASEACPNGESNLWSYYDNLGDERVEQIQRLKPDGTTRCSFVYNYDAEGEILQWSNAPASGVPSQWTFAYDSASELSNAVLTTASVVADSHAYLYDPAGNRLQEGLLAMTNNYSYNALNQLIAGPASAANCTYQWDALQRLASVTLSNEQVQCGYDYRGRRTRITITSNSVVLADRNFVWCDNGICEEHDGSGNVVKRFYQQGVQVVSGSPAGNFFYVRDHLGSIRALTDNSGSLISAFDYDPFGRMTQSAGTSPADFGFAGQFYEATSGLNLTLYRAYNPSTGRWLSRDPLVPAELRQGANLYIYCKNNPLNRIDPLGLNPLECIAEQQFVGFFNCLGCAMGLAAEAEGFDGAGTADNCLGCMDSLDYSSCVPPSPPDPPAPPPPAPPPPPDPNPPDPCDGDDPPTPCNPQPMCQAPAPDPISE